MRNVVPGIFVMAPVRVGVTAGGPSASFCVKGLKVDFFDLADPMAGAKFTPRKGGDDVKNGV